MTTSSTVTRFLSGLIFSKTLSCSDSHFPLCYHFLTLWIIPIDKYVLAEEARPIRWMCT
jgi:hypothetical protein